MIIFWNADKNIWYFRLDKLIYFWNKKSLFRLTIFQGIFWDDNLLILEVLTWYRAGQNLLLLGFKYLAIVCSFWVLPLELTNSPSPPHSTTWSPAVLGATVPIFSIFFNAILLKFLGNTPTFQMLTIAGLYDELKQNHLFLTVLHRRWLLTVNNAKASFVYSREYLS